LGHVDKKRGERKQRRGEIKRKKGMEKKENIVAHGGRRGKRKICAY